MARKKKTTAPTLNEVLAELGYKTRPRANTNLYGKVLVRDGVAVWEGTAGACWEWLRKTGQIA
jgi:hypothetical protein